MGLKGISRGLQLYFFLKGKDFLNGQFLLNLGSVFKSVYYILSYNHCLKHFILKTKMY